MELHQAEGTKSEVGVKRAAGSKRRVSPRIAPTTPLVAGRGELTAPVGLDRDAGKAWLELRGQCDAVLDLADAAMLEVAAVALGRFRQARRAVGVEILVEGRFGSPVEHPALKVERDAAAMLHRAMVELGIGPSARARFAGVGAEAMTADAAFPGLSAVSS